MSLSLESVELHIQSLSNRVTELEQGESQALNELKEVVFALADSLGIEIGYGPYAVKREFAEELMRKGVGRIGFKREEQE